MKSIFKAIVVMAGFAAMTVFSQTPKAVYQTMPGNKLVGSLAVTSGQTITIDAGAFITNNGTATGFGGGAAAAGTLTGTTLAANVVNSSLTNAAGGSFGTNAFNSTDFVPTSTTVNGQPLSSDVNITTITGNAGTATTLATGRTISITGDLSYTSPSFNGSGNVTAAGTLATVNATVGSFNLATVIVNAKGLVTFASTAPSTGTGNVVRQTSPVLVTASLGVPVSGDFRTGTFTWPTFNQDTTGSAAKLTTSRNINGVAFDGTADITVTAAAGTLTGTTLAANVVSSSLTSAAGGSFGTGAYAVAFDPASPGAIGGVTAGSGAFTSITANPANNATGVNVSGGSITGSGTTPFENITGTFNTSGDAVGVKWAFTKTALGAGGRFFQILSGTNPIFSVTENGYFAGGGGVGISDAGGGAMMFTNSFGATVLAGITNGGAIYSFGGNITVTNSQFGGHPFSMTADGTTTDLVSDFSIIRVRNGTNAQALRVYDASGSTYLEASNTLKVHAGTNLKSGTFTMATGAATVANTSITANSVIHASPQAGAVSGTVLPICFPTVTAGTGFTVLGGSLDNSTYNYWIEENN